MEDRKGNQESGTSARVIGTKVSQIANIFQSKGNVANVGESELHVPHQKVKRDASISPKNDQKELFREPKSITETVTSQITVVRTESHVARFNSAKALFEKLGTSEY